MASMKKEVTRKSEREIDELVIAQADNDSAWEKPVPARQVKRRAISIPAEVASRAAFFARLHRESSVEDWIKKIVAERVDIEEAAFAEAKRDLATQ
jgi:hypothetical protein